MFWRRKSPAQVVLTSFDAMMKAALGYPSPSQIQRSLGIVCPARIWSIDSEGGWFEARCVMMTNARYPGPHAGLHATKEGVYFSAEDSKFFMKIHHQATETE